MDDNQSDSLWAQFRSLFRDKDEETPLQKAISEAREEGDVAAEDAAMLLNALKLHSLTVYDVCIPRTDMVCAEITDGVRKIGELIVESGHSRIPVYKDDRDNIVGLVYAKDLLPALLEGDPERITIAEIMRPVLFVPENKSGRDMLREFLGRRTHLAIALDEYGGTSGLVTLEDVIEEIVGEIEDEHDVEGPEEFRFEDDGSVHVSGRAPLDELAEVIGLELTSEQVETIGGYLSELSGRVPHKGDIFTLSGRRIIVEDADKKQVRWLRIEPPAGETISAD